MCASSRLKANGELGGAESEDAVDGVTESAACADDLRFELALAVAMNGRTLTGFNLERNADAKRAARLMIEFELLEIAGERLAKRRTATDFAY
jgi:hypothetical protein